MSRAIALLLIVLAAAGPPRAALAGDPSGDHGGRLRIDEFGLVHGPDGSALRARLDVVLAPSVIEALRNGVPITFRWRFQLREVGSPLWHETLWETGGRLRLDYRSLSRRYSLTDTATDTQRSFPDLRRLLEALGRLHQPLPPLRPVIASGEAVRPRLRLNLELGALPPALRLPGFLARAWRQDTGWVSGEAGAPVTN